MSAEQGAAASDLVAAQVEPHAVRVAGRLGCELVSTRHLHEGGSWVLRIVIDKPGGVGVDDCAAVSRQLSAILDVEDFVLHAYRLEVSSPGLDQELLVAEDYRRYRGRRVSIQTDAASAGGKIVRGVLHGLREGSVVVREASGETLEIPLRQVAAARLEVDI